MAGPSDLADTGHGFPDPSAQPTVRRPVVAGMFYPDDPEACRREAHSYLRPSHLASAQSWMGALVPHAGWVCSGAIAGQAIATLAAAGSVDVVVIFGAVHSAYPVSSAALDSHRRWWLPSGESTLCQELQQRLLEQPRAFVVDPRLHAHEHAVEVELPLVQSAFPGAAVLPVEVPLNEDAVEVGEITARVIAQTRLRAVYLASSDLTHYGPNYGFAPAGVGLEGLNWARDNDRRLLDLLVESNAEAIVPEVQRHLNACGGGAIAALVAACRQQGASAVSVLQHASSYETLQRLSPQRPDNAVGYAGVVMG